VAHVRVASLQPCVVNVPKTRATTFIIRKYWVRNVTHIFNFASFILWFLYESYVAFPAKQMKDVNTSSALKVHPPPHTVDCVRKVTVCLT
jgi:hypothetical protein